MPRNAKQVRFAPQSIVYPPETFIPAIALSFAPSDSSSSSSSTFRWYSLEADGLPGPTPYVRLCTPRTKLPEPVKFADRHRCHPLLMTSAITYDLRDPVSTATTTHNHHSLSVETLHQSAFTPPLSRITITSSYLPWTIKVYASNACYITLQDILNSIYSVSRTNITPTEFQLIPSHHHRKRATRAYQERYRRLLPTGNSELNKASQSEKHAGMKRVDFLMGHTKFIGISSKWGQPSNEWNLHVASS